MASHLGKGEREGERERMGGREGRERNEEIECVRKVNGEKLREERKGRRTMEEDSGQRGNRAGKNVCVEGMRGE